MSWTEDSITIKKAAAADLQAITRLLNSVDLPPDGIADWLQHSFLAWKNAEPVGSIALEIYDQNALLRSLAVKKEWQGRGISNALIETVFQYAVELGLASLYLLTESVPAYFESKGFSRIARNDIPAAVKSSIQLAFVCPASATAMMKRL